MNYFVTGTDTGVGKTFVTALLTRSLRASGLDTVALKPISCGGLEDVNILREAADDSLNADVICPVQLPLPAAPYANTLIGESPADIEKIKETYQHVRRQHRSILVEGVGGWLVPIHKDYCVRDLAKEIDLPVVVVAANRLGVINHTLLTVESIHASGLTCAGVILNQTIAHAELVANSNRAILKELLDVPIILDVAHGETELGLAIA